MILFASVNIILVLMDIEQWELKFRYAPEGVSFWWNEYDKLFLFLIIVRSRKVIFSSFSSS